LASKNWFVEYRLEAIRRGEMNGAWNTKGTREYVVCVMGVENQPYANIDLGPP